MKQAAIKPIYRSKAFVLGLIGFFGVLGVWVDSCRYRTAWDCQVIPKRVSTNFAMMQGTLGVGVFTASATSTDPAYWERKSFRSGFGPEMATIVKWDGDRGMMMIRVWKLVAMYLAYWSVLMTWRVWSYRRAARGPGPA